MNAIAWVRAARPPAQSNIAPSLILGQALAHQQTLIFSWEVFAWLLAFGIFDQLYIVFANDV
ncbi:MAG: prenyltransferase, partial [Myxococcota bacterium]